MKFPFANPLVLIAELAIMPAKLPEFLGYAIRNGHPSEGGRKHQFRHRA